MGYSWGDAASDAHYAELEDAALREADAAAELTAREFVGRWLESPLRPEVRVDLDIGGDDQPVFVFSLNVGLDDDLDPADYPGDDLAALTSDLRARIAESPVDEWDWLVTIGSKASARS